MVFAIGWSGVSMASVKTMHISMEQMMHEMPNQQNVKQIDQQPHTMQNMSVSEMKAHCADLQMQSESHAHSQDSNTSNASKLSHDQQMQSLKDCHGQLIQSKQALQTDCQECALFSCQSSIVWFNSDIPKLSLPHEIQHSQALNIAYYAQHLSGHWQEILRPPKA